MNFKRIVISGVAGFIAYLLVGTVLFTIPGMKAEYAKFPLVYRDQAGIQRMIPVALASTFVAILVLSIIYAKGYEGGRGAAEGARFGILIGIFAVCTFVFHNYVNLNIGLKLTLLQAACYFLEWVIVGVVIGLTYRPAGDSAR